MNAAEGRYSSAAIVVHWLTAAALSLIVALGLRVSGTGGAERDSALQLHVSLGVCVLWLSVFRIAHRTLQRPPTPSPHLDHWLPRVVHRAFYGLLIGVPVLGWLNVSGGSAGSTYRLFGLIPWPGIPGVGGSSAVGDFAEPAHRYLAYLLCALLALHVTGAVKRHLTEPATGLARMLPGERSRFGWRSAAVVAVLVLLFTIGRGSGDFMLPRALRIVSSEPPPRPSIDPRKSTLFASLVQPILEEKCVACHGERAQKGGLRLDSFDAVHEGGDGGRVVEAGKLPESELVRRLMLPKSDRDAMPPKDKAQVTPAEAQLVLWWIDAGADGETTIVAANPPPLVQQILRDLGITNESPVFAEPVARASPEVLDRLGTLFQVRHVYADGGFLRARALFARDAAAAASSVAALAEITGQLVWLDLSGTGMTDDQLSGLERLQKLQRLNLAGTAAGDRTIGRLRHLAYLEVLTLYDTVVTDAALAELARMPSLATVYLSGTAVTAAGVDRFRRDHRQVRVVWQPPDPDATVTMNSAPGARKGRINAQSP